MFVEQIKFIDILNATIAEYNSTQKERKIKLINNLIDDVEDNVRIYILKLIDNKSNTLWCLTEETSIKEQLSIELMEKAHRRMLFKLIKKGLKQM